MMKKVIEKLLERKSLTAEESFDAGRAMVQGADPTQAAAFLALLRAKEETVDELLGLVKAIRAELKKPVLDRPFLDIAGTGGDGSGTVNISTASALLAARCGIPVIKGGNRASSSRCGAADVLEELGIDIHIPPDRLQEVLDEKNFVFCFAPDYYPAYLKLRAMRKGLNLPTALNLLGPLLNPAGVDYLMVGVYHPKFVQIVAETLFRLGTKRSIVYHSHGLDELTCIGHTDALLVTSTGIEPFKIDPEKLGLKKCTLEDLKGGDAKENAKIIQKTLRGEMTMLTHTLVLNVAVAFFLYGPAKNLEEGVKMTNERLSRKNSLKEAIQRGHAVIAEVKKSSPAKGQIGRIDNIVERAILYVEGGAAAVSIHTSKLFEGSLDDLKNASKVMKERKIPVLRKDFILREEQIVEAAETGADVVLLIVTFLGSRTKEMLQAAHQLGLEAIVEVHSEEELQIAIDAGAEIIGVNQRDLKAFIAIDEKGEIVSLNRKDLKDFTMHPEIFEKLIGKIPADIIKIAESGIKTPEDAHKAFRLGYDAVLIGETLTRTEDPQGFIAAMRSPVHAR